MEKPICVKVVHWAYRASASKALCNMLEDYKFLSLVKGRGNRLKVSDSLVDEKDSASWSKIILRINKNDKIYRGVDMSIARPTSRCILFVVRKFSFDTSLVIYINSTNIPPIMIINRVYENQNLLSL